jgi:antitoxin component YwqK of YwqJK toxin-antitoxin module
MRGKSLVALLVVMLVGCGQRSPDNGPSLAPVESEAKAGDGASQVPSTSDKQTEAKAKGAGDPAPKAESAFVPLFNGKNLDGWQVREARPGDKDKWSVKDGILVAEPGSGWIGTTKTYGDFVLKVEWRISEGGNSGVYIRMPEVTTSKEAADKGLEVQILDDNDPKWKGKDLQPWMWCGSLYTVQGPSKKVFKGAGQWNEYEITCKGGRIGVVFNGEKVVDVDASNRPKQGFIGFQNHGSKVEFRSVQVKELSEDKLPAVEEVRQIAVPSATRSLAISADGQKVLSGHYDKKIRLWDWETGKELWSAVKHSKWVTGVGISPNGKLAISCSTDSSVRLWDLDANAELARLDGHNHDIWSAVISSDGNWGLSGGADRVMRLWDLEKRQLASQFTASGGIWAVAFAPDNQMVAAATGGGTNTIHVWNIATKKELCRFANHTNAVYCISFSPDSTKIISGSADNTIRMWSLKDRNEIRRFDGHSGTVFSVSLSPDGKQIASGSEDKTVRIWDTETGSELYRFEGHSPNVQAVAFHPSGEHVVSGGGDNAIRVWRVPKQNGKAAETKAEEKITKKTSKPIAQKESTNPKVLQTETWAWKGSKDNYANYSDGTFEIGMGAEKNGIGIAAVGVETRNVKLVRIAVHVQDGRGASYSSIDANSFAGFIIDYSTDGVYRNRVALATGPFSEKRWAKVPHWGSMDLPTRFERIKTGNVTAFVHSLDLTKWAPPNWDGRAWVTVLLQNTGKNTSMRGIIWFPDDDEKNHEEGFAGQYLLTFTGSGSGKTKWDFRADGTASESTEINSSAWKLMGSWRAVDKRIVLTFTNPKFGTTILEKNGDSKWEGDNTHANGAVFHWVLTRQNTEVAKIKTTPSKTNEELLREQLAKPFEFHDDKRKERESLLKANGFDKLGYDKGPNGEELIVKHGNEKVTLLGGAVTDLDFSVSGFINRSKEFVPHGRRVTWYRKPSDEKDAGKPFTESYFFNGKRHGLTLSWCTNGRLGELVAYVEGLRQGPYQKWYDNGDKYSAGVFKNDKLEGEYSSWYCGGSRWEACTFKNGVLDGIATVYWQAELGGKPLKIVTWSQGVKNGPEVHYHWQGHKEREMTWLNGRLHGNYIEYENGLIRLKMAFSNGVPVISP